MKLYALISYTDLMLERGTTTFVRLSCIVHAGGLSKGGGEAALFQSERPSDRVLLNGNVSHEGGVRSFDMGSNRMIRLLEGDHFSFHENFGQFVGFLRASAYNSARHGSYQAIVEETYMRSCLNDESFGSWMSIADHDIKIFSPRVTEDDELVRLRIL